MNLKPEMESLSIKQKVSLKEEEDNTQKQKLPTSMPENHNSQSKCISKTAIHNKPSE